MSKLRATVEDPIGQALLIAAGAGLLGGLYLAFMTLRAGDSMHFDVTLLSTNAPFAALVLLL